MKEKTVAIMGGIGFMMMLLGVASMDSEQILIPAILTIVGVLMCCIAAHVLPEE